MDESLDQLRPTSTEELVTMGLVATLLVAILAAEAPMVLFALVIVAPMMWFFARAELGDEDGSDAVPADDETALDRLRRRYAEGDLTDEEFERRLDRLLETETLDDAQRRRERKRDRGTGRDRDPETDREHGRETNRERNRELRR